MNENNIPGLRYTVAQVIPEGGIPKGVPVYTTWFAVAENGEVFGSPKLIGMSDQEAFYCCSYDGTPIIAHRKRLLVPLSWMQRERPDKDEKAFEELKRHITQAFKGLAAS